MYSSGTRYTAGLAQTAGFPTSGFVPASSLAQTGQNPFAGGGYTQQAASSGTGAVNPFQTACSQNQSQSAFPSHMSQSSAFPSAFPQSTGFPTSYSSSFPSHQPFPSQPTSAFPTAAKGSKQVYTEGYEVEGQTRVPILHICSSGQYADRSTEELRLEDYTWNKGKGGASPFPPAGSEGTQGRVALGQRLGAGNPFATQTQGFAAQSTTFMQNPQTRNADSGFGYSAFARSQSDAPTPPKTGFGVSAQAANPFAVATQSAFQSATAMNSTAGFPMASAGAQSQSAGQHSFFVNPTQQPPRQSPFPSSDQPVFPTTSSVSHSFSTSQQSTPFPQSSAFPQPSPFPQSSAVQQSASFPQSSAFQPAAALPQSFPQSNSFPQSSGFQPSTYLQPSSSTVFPTPQAPKPDSFQPQQAPQVSPVPYSDGISVFAQGFRDPLGLGWLFPNGVPEELRAGRSSVFATPRFTATEELLRTKGQAVYRVAEDSMSSLWRRSRCPKAAKPHLFPDPRPAPSASSSVFSKRPFKDIKFEPYEGSESMYSLKRASPKRGGVPFAERINDGCDRPTGKILEEGKKPKELRADLPRATPAEARKTVYGNPPVSTRAGYYTVPSAEALSTMTSEELRTLGGFTVGNEHGKVVFDGVTDVEGLDLDRVVVIEHKAVTMYPDGESSKPPVGQSLNKPATVHLYHCTARNPATSPVSFELKIRKVCERNNSRFLSYDAATGEWVFRVEHF